MGSIANIIARGIQPIPAIKSANEQEAERIGLAQAREQQRQAVQATAKAEVERRKAEQLERDQQALGKALESWDPKQGGMALVSRVVQLGGSPGLATKQAESMANLKRDWAAASKTEQETIKAQHEQARGLLSAISQATDVPSRQRLLEQALATELFKPEDLTPEALPNTINGLKVGDWVAAEGLTTQRTATLKAQEEAAKAQRVRTEAGTPGVDRPFPAPVMEQKKALQAQPAAKAPLVSRHTNARGEVTEILTDAATGAEISRRNLGAIGKPMPPREPKVATPKPPTGAEKTALGFYNRAKEAVETLTIPVAGGPSLEDRVGSSLISQARLKMPNITQSDDQQAYNQAQRAFTEARLRKESGAAVPPREYENDRKTYFAQPGDSKATIDQKRRSRQAVLDGLAYQAGKAYEEFYGEPRAPGANPPGVAPPAVEPPKVRMTIRARNSKGKLHEAEAGTPLPSGWTLEK
jgi:hypothetical protein